MKRSDSGDIGPGADLCFFASLCTTDVLLKDRNTGTVLGMTDARWIGVLMLLIQGEKLITCPARAGLDRCCHHGKERSHSTILEYQTRDKQLL